jgi:hypothetical protein
LQLKQILWGLGPVIAAVLFFAVVPAEKVNPNVYEYTPEQRSGWDAWRTDLPEPKILHKKSGLRMAIEGRLVWLGVL